MPELDYSGLYFMYVDSDYCKFHVVLVFQIFGMSMWNYGPDVMDALVELIVKLVCGYLVILLGFLLGPS